MGGIGGGGGQTVVAPKSSISANEEKSPMFLFAPGVNLSDIVDAVNKVGTTPSDPQGGPLPASAARIALPLDPNLGLVPKRP